MTSHMKMAGPGWRAKRKFLKYIRKDKNSGIFEEENISSITKTNYNNPISPQGLVDLFHKYLDPPLIKVIGIPYALDSIWYQVYGKNTSSFHDYHQHMDCNISGIYYLRLRDPRLRTEFLYNNQTIIPEVEEGDLVIFDSSIYHRSPPNRSNHDKIILSFNLRLIK